MGRMSILLAGEEGYVHLSFMSGKPCPGFTDFITRPWTRVT